MPIRTVEDISKDLSIGIRQLRRWGFRIIREPIPGDDENKRHEDALLAACVLLGLDSTTENKHLIPVNELARALLQNA